MQLQVFKYQDQGETIFNEVRTVDIDGVVWFVGIDIASNLGYKQPKDAIRNHCNEKGAIKRRLPSEGGPQSMTLINEGNVYRLIIKSKLPAAQAFEEWLFDTVIPEIHKTGSYAGVKTKAELPNFTKRFQANIHKIPRTHFSVITEMYVRLYSEMEKYGYVIPDLNSQGNRITPDLSIGITFANHLRKNRSEHFENRGKYWHSFDDGRKTVYANMYPIAALPEFIEFLFNIWLPNYAENYFKKADPVALDYIPKLLETP